MTNEDLFLKLYRAETEDCVQKIIDENPIIFNNPKNWSYFGDQENNFSVIENQQANPIAALVEKITNSIDALLMRRCYEERIEPEGGLAPKTIEDAVEKFFPDSKYWNASKAKNNQAEDIQIIAHGPKKDTSLVIYDNGEGQHPKDFPNTLLSLLRGNKKNIPFVQGKYNMGGTGAIVFCGKKHYHLIGSRRYTSDGMFGFTLIRRHPRSSSEKKSFRNTWYEYLRIDEKIPSFSFSNLDLGLRRRQFKTGTILKLYSYQLPKGATSVISRDLNRNLNEYLFKPALPIFTIDSQKRYPNDLNPERSLYGLKRMIEQEDSKYILDHFSIVLSDDYFGEFKITCYIFKSRIEGKSFKESRETIRREFFKSNMSVLFSLNGQVHGHYTSEFITRSLKMNLLSKNLLIHIDCSKIDTELHSQIFMASRDRLKDGEVTSILRKKLTKVLDDDGRLRKHNHDFKSKIDGNEKDSEHIIKNIGKILPLNSEMEKLLKKTLNLNEIQRIEHGGGNGRQKTKKEKPSFKGNRYPSIFKIKKSQEHEGLPMIQIPKKGQRNIKFETDVENNYFDRTEDAGELKIAILSYGNTSTTQHDSKKTNNNNLSTGNFFSARTSSPNDGIIAVYTEIKEDTSVNDTIQVKATLSNQAGDDLQEIFFIKILEEQKNKPKKNIPKHKKDNIGLPGLSKVYKDSQESSNSLTWEKIENVASFDEKVIMFPLIEGDKIEKIYINMDSHAFQKVRSRQKNEEQIGLITSRYISSVYFHTLFLYTISKRLKFATTKDGEEVELGEYLQDVFNNNYTDFLLSFETNALLETLES